jgi:hypothetical protein
MSEAALTVVRIVCLVPQAIGVAYAALLGWLLGAWMADASWAARASDAAWGEALNRS